MNTSLTAILGRGCNHNLRGPIQVLGTVLLFFGVFKLILLERSTASDHHQYAEVLHNLLCD